MGTWALTLLMLGWSVQAAQMNWLRSGDALPEARQRSVDELVELLRERGAVVAMDSMRVLGLGARRGEALVATTALPKGHVLLRVPSTLDDATTALLSPRAVLRRWPEWARLQLPDSMLLALALAVERHHLRADTRFNRLVGRETQRWGPWMALLPERCYHACTMDARDVQWLTAAGYEAGPAPRLVSDAYKVLVASDFTSAAFPVTLEQLKWAYCMVATRTLQGSNAVPLADLLVNPRHGQDLNVGLTFTFSAASVADMNALQRTTKSDLLSSQVPYTVVFETLRDVRQGEELVVNSFADERQLSNADTLLNYGFVGKALLHDELVLLAPPLSGLAVEKQLLIQHLLPKDRPRLFVTWGGFDERSLAAIRVMVEPDKVDSYFFTRVHGRNETQYPSLANEIELCRFIAMSCQASLMDLFGSTDVQAIARSLAPTREELQRRDPRVAFREFQLLHLQLLARIAQAATETFVQLQRFK